MRTHSHIHTHTHRCAHMPHVFKRKYRNTYVHTHTRIHAAPNCMQTHTSSPDGDLDLPFLGDALRWLLPRECFFPLAGSGHGTALLAALAGEGATPGCAEVRRDVLINEVRMTVLQKQIDHESYIFACSRHQLKQDAVI